MDATCPHCASPLPLARGDDDTCPSCGGALTHEPSPSRPARIDRYEVLGLLGRGGMGRVYLARDPRLGREVAIKVLPPEQATDVQRLARFRREARVASALNHPHICTIHDVGEADGHPYIVMERVEGRVLPAPTEERLTPERVVAIGVQAARALAAAHGAGIVHRDVKPGNVMVRADGYVKVVDFGLARPLDHTTLATDAREPDLTAAGGLVGSVRYMSPEQARGREVDGASDVFSLGIVLYELATGRHPFQADSQAELIQAILSHPPVPADRVDPSVAEPLAELLQRMLASDPVLRPSATEVAESLEALQRGRPGTGPRPPRAAPSRAIVGRTREREQIARAFEDVARGRGCFVCVTGEPGIGKTTLMEEVLADLEGAGRAGAIARGRCSERLAGSEAYLPVLEALEGLLRTDGGAAARTMRTVAPSWFAQVAPLAGEDSSVTRALQEGGGVSQERLKRELVALVRALSSSGPFVLVLDDVHWSDASTVDLLAYLGARAEDLPILLLLPYRPADLARNRHPFGALKLDLGARGLCREVPLGLLAREDVDRYVDLTFPGHRFPAALGALIHARTEGSPLFMADLLRYLRDSGVLVEEEGRWVLGRPLPDLEDRLPESVRSMVQRKIEQLAEDDLRLLVAASVQGVEADALIVAEALGLDPADVEDRLAELDRVHGLATEVGEHELPDRELTMRYRFVHVLYQNALYATLRPTRRAALCRAVAEALLRHHGEDAHVAAELAILFEGAREPERSARFFLRAARQAVRLFANHESAALARRGLDRARELPPSEARDRLELTLLLTLGPPLKDTLGWAAPEVGEVYTRANELGERVGSAPDLFPALWGVWMMFSSTADVPALLGMGERLLRVAEDGGAADQRLQAHHALTTTHFLAGHFATSLRHARAGMALYDPVAHADHAFLYGGHDPGACCCAFAAQDLWMLGWPDQGLEHAMEAVRMAERRGHPVSIALNHWTLAILHQHRREPEAALRAAERCEEVTLDQGAPIFPGFIIAWALAEQGEPEAALLRLENAFAHPERIPLWWHAAFLDLVAQVQWRAGRPEEALAALAEAHTMIGDRGFASYAAERLRLQGTILHAATPERAGEAEATLRRALDLARAQQARMLELRTLVSLGRLLATQGRLDEVRPALEALHATFTEGFDTLDLREARALLEETA